MDDEKIGEYLSQIPAVAASHDEKLEEITAAPYPYYARKDTLKTQNAFLIGNWTPTSGYGCRNPGRMAILISHIKEISEIGPCDGGSVLVKCELKGNHADSE